MEMEKLVDIVHFLNLEIHTAFGRSDGDKPVKNHHQKLGSVGLALHYATIITQIDTLVTRSSSVPPSTRDALYHGIPPVVIWKSTAKHHNSQPQPPTFTSNVLVGWGGCYLGWGSPFFTYYYVCEEISHHDLMQDEVNTILTAVVQGMNVTKVNQEVRNATTRALYNALDFAQTNFKNEIWRGTIL